MDTSTVVASTDTLGRRIAPRRHRTIEEKLAIVAESLTPGASVAEVARRHGMNANLLFIWRRLHERGMRDTHTACEGQAPGSCEAVERQRDEPVWSAVLADAAD